MIAGSKTGELELWFVTGSQHLYGPEVIKEVKQHAETIVRGLNESKRIPVSVVHKAVLTTSDAVSRALGEASATDRCIGVIAWMHTFSPAQMWIPGLQELTKPLCHLHTQYNREIPWSTIDMDFMNLNQSAHGGREFEFSATQLGKHRKIIVGHWEEPGVQSDLGAWASVALAHYDAHHGRIARFGDNMRRVAVTEGNKVSARTTFGYAVEGFGVGDLVEYLNAVPDSDIDNTVEEYRNEFSVTPELLPGGERHEALRYAARQELGIRSFLEEGGFTGFTTTFEDLHGLDQLPGLAPQRLMQRGYGFAAEGDWKTAALLRAAKVMEAGRAAGTSFMEDYTYHYQGEESLVLGAHMLEICPSIAGETPRVEIHPLGIGGKSDPVRAVFDGRTGRGRNATLVDLGRRFRMVLNEVDAVPSSEPMPNLPVARILWKPLPSLKTSATAWMLAGGAHHTVYTDTVSREQLLDYARMTGIEAVVIDEQSSVETIEEKLRWNEAYYRFSGS